MTYTCIWYNCKVLIMRQLLVSTPGVNPVLSVDEMHGRCCSLYKLAPQQPLPHWSIGQGTIFTAFCLDETGFGLIYLDVPLDECIRRNSQRKSAVDESVIERMSERLEAPCPDQQWQTNFVRLNCPNQHRYYNQQLGALAEDMCYKAAFIGARFPASQLKTWPKTRAIDK